MLSCSLRWRNEKSRQKTVISTHIFLLLLVLSNNLLLNSILPSTQMEEDSKSLILHGASKDSLVVLSIPEPVCGKFHLFANIISQFNSWPTSSKQRSAAQKMIKEYLFGVTDKSLFSLARKDEKETYQTRYYETNPNGLCGGINLFQLDKRHKHGYTSAGFKNEALNFHNANTREDLINFLRKIKPVSSSKEKDNIASSIQAMIEWTQQKFFTDCSSTTKKSPRNFPLKKWWHNYWYLMIQDVVPLTLFQNTEQAHIPTGYLMATMSSVPNSEGFRFTFPQILEIANLPNYCRYDSNHFFLEPPVLAKEESKRMNQALVDLSKNILNYILHNFSGSNQEFMDNTKCNNLRSISISSSSTTAISERERDITNSPLPPSLQ